MSDHARFVKESQEDVLRQRWTLTDMPQDNPMSVEEDIVYKDDADMAEVDEDFRLVDEAVLGRRGEDQEAIARFGLRVLATLIRKNTDYGSSAWKPPMLCPGMTARQGLQCRLSDKIQRLQTLLASDDPMVVEESVEDTFGDMVGYGILWLACPEEDDCGE